MKTRGPARGRARLPEPADSSAPSLRSRIFGATRSDAAPAAAASAAAAQAAATAPSGGAAAPSGAAAKDAGWARRSLAATGRCCRANVVFGVVLAIGAGLRVLVGLAYQPALEFYGDSFLYLHNARTLIPGRWHPIGYAVLLRALSPTGALVSVTIAQHVFGLGLAVALYVLLVRLGVRRWLAAIGTLPILLDGYQLDIEQFILSETLLDVLLVAGLLLILWRPRPRAWQGALAALFFAAATLTRTAALPVLIIAAVYLLLRWAWRPLLSGIAVAAIVLIGYGSWYSLTNGHFAFSDYNGIYLYGRVAPFVTCDYTLTYEEQRLCPLSPVAKRPQNDEFFVWAGRSRLYQGHLGTHYQRNQLAERFSIKVIENQPADYVKAVWTDVLHYFSPGRQMSSDRVDLQRWRFPGNQLHTSRDKLHVSFARTSFDGKRIRPHVDVGLTKPLRAYQSVVYTQGPVLLGCLAAALIAAAGLIRRRGPPRLRQARWAALLLAATAAVLIVSPALVTGFSYRYQLPLLVLLPPAAVIGAETALTRFWRRRKTSAPSP